MMLSLTISFVATVILAISFGFAAATVRERKSRGPFGNADGLIFVARGLCLCLLMGAVVWMFSRYDTHVSKVNALQQVLLDNYESQIKALTDVIESAESKKKITANKVYIPLHLWRNNNSKYANELQLWQTRDYSYSTHNPNFYHTNLSMPVSPGAVRERALLHK